MNILKMNFINNQAIPYVSEFPAPRKGSPTAAGYDLTADREYTLEPKKRTVVGTGFSCALPNNWYGKVEGRSGLAFKHFIFPFGGIIDSDYRGEVKVLLVNCGEQPYHIKKGERIAQLIIQPHWNGIFTKVDHLYQTARGEEGFGSSGRTDARQRTLTEMWQMPDGRSEEQLNQELAGMSRFDVGYPRD